MTAQETASLPCNKTATEGKNSLKGLTRKRCNRMASMTTVIKYCHLVDQ